MMIKIALLFLLCIAPSISLDAMDISVQEETELYNKWQQVTRTREFIRCTKLLKNSCDSSNPEYQNASKALQLTKEFIEYKNYCSLPSTNSGRTVEENPFVVSLSNHTNTKEAL